MMRLVRSLMLTTVALMLAGPAVADTNAQFVFAGIEAPQADNIDNFRFSLLFAKANRMSGFDLGFASITQDEEFNGFGPLFAIALVSGNSQGCLCSFANFVNGESQGINAGFINVTQKMTEGANIGFLNITQGFSSTDISALAISQTSNVQVGLVNVTNEIQGVQIGFLNFAKNGFFPVFPFFNYPKSD